MGYLMGRLNFVGMGAGGAWGGAGAAWGERGGPGEREDPWEHPLQHGNPPQIKVFYSGAE